MGADKKTFGEQIGVNSPIQEPKEVLKDMYVYDYGALSLAAASAAHGGFEYAKTGNVQMLGLGLFLGAVMGYGGWQVSKNPDAYQLPMLGSLALTGFHAKKYMESKRLVPYGLVAGLGAYVFARYAARAFGFMEAPQRKL